MGIILAKLKLLHAKLGLLILVTLVFIWANLEFTWGYYHGSTGGGVRGVS